MSRHFKKAVISQPFRFNGAVVPFEHVGNNTGVRNLDETHDAPLIAELDRTADARRGGIMRISAEIYESLKKNKVPWQPSVNRSKGLQPIRAYQEQTLSPQSNNLPKPAVESAVMDSQKPAEGLVKIMLPPPTGNQRLSHAPGFKLNSKPRSEVEAKVKEATAPE